MYTAISSLNLHQNYLDVIADNLANANTVGYKSSRVVFQDQFAQIINPGLAPSATQGGINPTQIGLGVQVGYISPVFTQGTMQNTGVNTDLAIQGDGFFIYNQGADQMYSRDGSLEIDGSGQLVNNSTGMQIQGWQLAPGATTVNTNAPTTSITIPLNSTLARATTSANMGGNLDATAAAGTAVDTTIGVYDSLGVLHTVNVTFTRQATPTPAPSPMTTDWNWSVTGPAGAAGNGTVTFDANGQYVAPVPATANTITLTGTNGANDLSMNMDVSNLTMLSDTSSIAATTQDGLAAGTVTDIYATPKTGEIYAVYSNGLKSMIGQLALARFTNPSGMIREGQNLFKPGPNAGTAQIGTANSNGRGAITPGYQEASNVDMAQEFTNMILAERGFQASSRVITTSDEILQELVNLKR
jgi:flagellar hook protein FlgE